MNRPITGVVLIAGLMTALACGHDSKLERMAETAAPRAAQPGGNEPTPDVFALGTRVTPHGLVAEDAEGEVFGRGTPLLLSVNTESASVPQTIEVEWRRGRSVLAKQRRHAKLADRAVLFDAGTTGRWPPGRHQAVVYIDGRKVATKEFALR